MLRFVGYQQSTSRSSEFTSSALIERGRNDLHLDLATAHVGIDMLTDLGVFDRHITHRDAAAEIRRERARGGPADLLAVRCGVEVAICLLYTSRCV